MKFLSSLSVRGKLLFLIFVSVLPALGIILYSGLERRENDIASTKRDILHLAHSLAAQQEQVAAGTMQMLKMLAQMPEVQNIDAKACNRIFRNIQKQNPVHAVISAVTPDGNMFAASLPFLPGSINLADRKHIRDAIKKRDYSTGEYIAGRVVKVPTIIYSYPVLDKNKNLVAIVSAGIHLSWLKEFMEQLNMPEGSVTSIADHKNITLYRFPESENIPPGTPLPLKNIQGIPVDSKEGIYEAIGRDNVSRIFAYKRLWLRDKEPWYLAMYVGVDKNLALHHANSRLVYNLVIIGSACLFAMLLAWIAGNAIIVEPLRKLAIATQRFGDGDLSVRTDLPHQEDEMGRLAKSFDTMAAMTEMKDIEQKQAEEENRSLEERLQRAEKMEALGTLAGGVAHDLNNVLGIVVGYAEMLLMDVEESDPIRPSLVNIMNGGERAAAIVDDLLTLARRCVPGRNVLNLNRIIADCQKTPEFANLSFHHPSVKIKTDIAPDLLNISGSSVHLVKTLFNLVSNASESMTKGGIVTIKTANQYLDKPIQGYDEVREGDYVVLSVSDTGEGIPAADLKRIFEPFYTKKVMGRSGTGLGLAVVWGTMKDHHGYINVESEEGKGSTFTLYFPVTREDISTEAVAIAISEYMGNGESILVVDDVKEQRDLAAGMLRKLNYSVTSISSGEEAIEYVKDHAVDLMVLDMIMDPGMDGLDTYRSILAIRPKQKAIIVSGFSESDRVNAAQKLGAGAYVRKPYVIEKLGLAVRKEQRRRVG